MTNFDKILTSFDKILTLTFDIFWLLTFFDKLIIPQLLIAYFNGLEIKITANIKIIATIITNDDKLKQRKEKISGTINWTIKIII